VGGHQGPANGQCHLLSSTVLYRLLPRLRFERIIARCVYARSRSVVAIMPSNSGRILKCQGWGTEMVKEQAVTDPGARKCIQLRWGGLLFLCAWKLDKVVGRVPVNEASYSLTRLKRGAVRAVSIHMLTSENCARWHFLEKNATWTRGFCKEQNRNRCNAGPF
jgi:hypothetical protein